MSDGKICLFTDNGQMHLVKVADIPYGKFRDKGIPVDNISNYDSSSENIISVMALEHIMDKKLLFVTEQSMCKVVSGSEFDVSKRTTAATKLQENDKILYLAVAEPESTMVLQSQKNYFLRFATEDIPEKKKGAVGVRGMRMTDGELLTAVWQLTGEEEQIIMIKEKAVHLNRLRIANRDTRGVKK
jgi:DNA gyrase subunit A